LGLQKLAFLAVAISQVSHSQKSAFVFSQQVSFLAGSGFQNWLRGFGQSFGKQAFLFGKVSFCGNRHFRQSQVSSIGFKVFSQGFGKLALGFFSGSLFLAKALVCKVIFSASVLASQALAFSVFSSRCFSQVIIAKNKVVCKS
jgi:hypothetical protein